MARLAFHAIVTSDVLHPPDMLLANAALPTFVPHILYLLVGLVLIVAVEAWFIRRLLGSLPWIIPSAALAGAACFSLQRALAKKEWLAACGC